MTAEQIADVVMTAVKFATAPLVERITELEAKALIVGPPGDPGAPGTPGEKGDRGKTGLAGEPGPAGKDADHTIVLELKAELAAVRSELVQMKSMDVPAMATHGQGVTVDDVAPMIRGLVEKSFAAVQMPKDGLGLKSAVVDRSGHLILTMSDGVEKDLGSIVGQDGRDGMPGIIGPPGADGKEGIDGHGFDDIEEELHDGGRLLVRRYRRGERVKEFRHKTSAEVYRGVYVDGKTYECGDGVTWGGSEWHANETTSTKPGDGSKAWTLKVKRGRDGKDAKESAAPFPVVSVGKR